MKNAFAWTATINNNNSNEPKQNESIFICLEFFMILISDLLKWNGMPMHSMKFTFSSNVFLIFIMKLFNLIFFCINCRQRV